jgi:hypothetical protein
MAIAASENAARAGPTINDDATVERTHAPRLITDGASSLNVIATSPAANGTSAIILDATN